MTASSLSTAAASPRRPRGRTARRSSTPSIMLGVSTTPRPARASSGDYSAGRGGQAGGGTAGAVAGDAHPRAPVPAAARVDEGRNTPQDALAAIRTRDPDADFDSASGSAGAPLGPASRREWADHQPRARLQRLCDGFPRLRALTVGAGHRHRVRGPPRSAPTQFRRGLHQPVPDRRDAERTLAAAGLRNHTRRTAWGWYVLVRSSASMPVRQFLQPRAVGAH